VLTCRGGRWRGPTASHWRERRRRPRRQRDATTAKLGGSIEHGGDGVWRRWPSSGGTGGDGVWRQRSCRGPPSAAALVQGTSDGGSARRNRATATMALGCIGISGKLLSVGEEEEGLRLLYPHPFSPGWWLQPGLKGGL
jgi:hypothetical protein